MDQEEQKRLNRAFIEAAKNNDLSTLKDAFARGASIHSEDGNEDNALHWAAHHDNLPMADFLIKNRINIHHQNRSGSTAICAALYKPDLMALLLEAGADPNTYHVRETLLMRSIVEKDIKSIHSLIRAGADVNLQDTEGQTALWYTVMRGDLQIVQILAEAGADPDIADNKGDTPAETAGRLPDRREISAYLKQFAQQKKAQEELAEEIASFNKGNLSRPMTAPQKLRPVRAPALKAGP